MSKAVRIIGIGSPVAGDAIGMQLVEQLREDPAWQGRGEIEWLVLERPGAALLHYFEGVETLCLIDALHSPHHQGVVRIAPEALLAQQVSLSSHQFGVAEALRLASVLQQLPPRLRLYGMVASPGCYDELKAMLMADLAE